MHRNVWGRVHHQLFGTRKAYREREMDGDALQFRVHYKPFMLVNISTWLLWYSFMRFSISPICSCLYTFSDCYDSCKAVKQEICYTAHRVPIIHVRWWWDDGWIERMKMSNLCGPLQISSLQIKMFSLAASKLLTIRNSGAQIRARQIFVEDSVDFQWTTTWKTKI